MIAPYGAYYVGDGNRIVIAIQNDREWVEFCEKVLDRVDLAKDKSFSSNVARIENRQDLDDIITQCFSAYDLESLCESLFKAKIAFGRFNEVSDLAAHPQLRWMPVNSVGGMVDVVAPPAIFSSAGDSVATVPSLGEHTTSVWAEYSARKYK
jgi:crotonobetainyl-CoA:carnitine CoA-transferase CaiB-like acyl-CoA transferase